MPHVPTYKIQPLAGENIAPVPIEDAIKEELQVSKANSYIWNVFYDFVWSKVQYLGVEQCCGCGGPEKTPGSTSYSKVLIFPFHSKWPKNISLKIIHYDQIFSELWLIQQGNPMRSLPKWWWLQWKTFWLKVFLFSGAGLAEADWEQSNQREGGFGAGLSQGSPQ